MLHRIFPVREIGHSFYAAAPARGVAPHLKYWIAPIVRQHAGWSAYPEDFSGQTPFIRKSPFSW